MPNRIAECAPLDLLKKYSWIILLATTLLIHGSNLFASWRFEDGYLLNNAAPYSPLLFFVDAEVSRQFSYAYITPWQGVFFHISAAINTPFWSYFLLLTIIFLCALLTYHLLTRIISPELSLFACLFFLLSPGTVAIAGMLMTAHYALGLLFFLITLATFSSKNRSLYMISVVSFAFACLCKEIYIPLPIALFFIFNGNLKNRIIKTMPFILALAVYFLWRWHVLGSFLGSTAGNSGSPLPWESFFSQLVQALLGHGISAWILLTIIAFIIFSSLRMKIINTQPNFFIIATSLVLFLIPLFAIRRFGFDGLATRYAFFPAWGLAIGLAYLCHHMQNTNKNIRTLTPIALLIFLIPSTFNYKSFLNEAARPMEQVYRALESSYNKETLIIVPSFSGTEYVAHYSDLQATNKPTTSAKLLKIEEDLFSINSSQTVLIYNNECKCLKDNYLQAIKLRNDLINELRSGVGRQWKGEVKFEMDHSLHSGKVVWQFEPWRDGHYEFRSDFLSINLPAAGSSRFGGSYAARPWRFYIRYRSPQGWAVQTPWLLMPIAHDTKVIWDEKQSCHSPWCKN
ncbi:hypothetical protein ABHF33_04295 [Chitinibacter sp. FCG-7]|uniref:Glycosyltransferase RgtA/B/C/D-like domain-containing protein n=1 Tax=Chitinibacter mangrovi TaxID=3153927 RepID=A0AAU7FBR9_9NEIS